MATYERRGTSLLKYSLNPRALHTHLFSGRHNLLMEEGGYLWADLQWTSDDGVIYGSDDQGFSWTVQGNGGDGSRENVDYGINGPGMGNYTIGSKDIYRWQSNLVSSTYQILITGISKDEGGFFNTDIGVYYSSSNFSGMYSVCENQNRAFVIYTFLSGGYWKFVCREISGVYTYSTVTQSTTDNYDDVYDCFASPDNIVYVACLNVNDGSTAPTVELLKYTAKLNRFETPVVIDTLPSTSHYVSDLSIARDGYGNIFCAWGEMDDYPGSSSVALRYAISKDDGATWTVTDLAFETGYSGYKDAIKAEYCTRTDVLGGYNGGFLFTYTCNEDSRTGTAKVEEIECEADTAGSLNNLYWWIYTDDTSHYVWYNVASGGTDPTPSAPSGRPSTTNGIEVAIATGATATAVATATASAIDGNVDFTATSSGAVVTATHTDAFPAKDAEDDDSNGVGWSSAWTVITLGKGTPRSFVRSFLTTDGSTYTLGDQIDITNTPSDWNIAGAKFFDVTKGALPNIEEPGNIRVAYQIEEGGDAFQDVYTPLHIDQDVLSVGPYPITYPSESGSYTVETAGVDELLVEFSIVDDIGNNIDFYDEGYIGEYTTNYLDVFEEYGTTCRILKYEPLQNSQMDDRLGYDEPVEYWVNIFIDPLTYTAPQSVEDPTNVSTYVEQDIRKVYIPPDLHLSRSFILNNGNNLKRTVWILQYAGNEYELTQVVPRIIDNQITHYDCNAYVVGPSYDPFSRVVLPSET